MELQSVGTSQVAQWERISLQCRRHRRFGFNPWIVEDPLERKWQPSPVFLLGKSHGERSWWATINPWDGKESEMTQHTCTLCIYILKVKAISLNKKTDK